MIVIFILWSVYGYFGPRVEQMDYSVIKKARDYEIRNYPTHIVAQTTVSGSYGDAMNKGFTIVAGYIFGGNTKKESVDMTSPVVMQEKALEKIAITAPVMVNMERKLLALLLEDKIEIVGTPFYIGYNTPGTPLWMIRNEVLIEIK